MLRQRWRPRQLRALVTPSGRLYLYHATATLDGDGHEGGSSRTGCSWSLAKDRRTRFAATDDHAVVRLASGVVRLRLAAGAGDLFPFAYNRWVGDSITVTVTPIGRSTWRRTEVNEGRPISRFATVAADGSRGGA